MIYILVILIVFALIWLANLANRYNMLSQQTLRYIKKFNYKTVISIIPKAHIFAASAAIDQKKIMAAWSDKSKKRLEDIKYDDDNRIIIIIDSNKRFFSGYIEPLKHSGPYEHGVNRDGWQKVDRLAMDDFLAICFLYPWKKPVKKDKYWRANYHLHIDNNKIKLYGQNPKYEYAQNSDILQFPYKRYGLFMADLENKHIAMDNSGLAYPLGQPLPENNRINDYPYQFVPAGKIGDYETPCRHIWETDLFYIEIRLEEKHD
jgi:hypothetical protein